MRIEVVPDDGPRFVRTITVADPAEIDVNALGAELGDATGSITIDYTIYVADFPHPFEQRLETRLLHGNMHGPAKNLARLEEEWRLTGEYVFENGVKNGPFVMYHPLEGTKVGEGFLKNGRRDGGAVWYYRDGKVQARTPYVDGAFHGRCEVYDANGTMLASGTYDHGSMLTGTFVENLEAYLVDSLTRPTIEPHVITIDDSGVTAPNPAP